MSSPLPPIPPAVPAGEQSPAISPKDRERLHKATVEMEAIFLQQLLKASQATVSRGLFGGGMAEDMFQDFLVEERAKGMAQSGGLGLARMLETEILRSSGKVLKKDAPAADTVNRQILQGKARKSYL